MIETRSNGSIPPGPAPDDPVCPRCNTKRRSPRRLILFVFGWASVFHLTMFDLLWLPVMAAGPQEQLRDAAGEIAEESRGAWQDFLAFAGEHPALAMAILVTVVLGIAAWRGAARRGPR